MDMKEEGRMMVDEYVQSILGSTESIFDEDDPELKRMFQMVYLEDSSSVGKELSQLGSRFLNNTEVSYKNEFAKLIFSLS